MSLKNCTGNCVDWKWPMLCSLSLQVWSLLPYPLNLGGTCVLKILTRRFSESDVVRVPSLGRLCSCCSQNFVTTMWTSPGWAVWSPSSTWWTKLLQQTITSSKMSWQLIAEAWVGPCRDHLKPNQKHHPPEHSSSPNCQHMEMSNNEGVVV